MRRAPTVIALVSLLVPVMLVLGGAGVAAPGAAGVGAATKPLQAFGSCDSLLAYAKQHALPLVGPYGLNGGPGGVAAGGVAGVAAPEAGKSTSAPVDYSTTNVQEGGVDEPDIVKSNGSTLYAIRANQLFAVDVRGSKPRLAGSLELPQGGSYELLLHGTRLLVLSRGGVYPNDGIGIGIRAPIRPVPAQSTLTEVNVADPAAMKIVRSLAFDAEILTGRLVGSVARIVTVTGMPQALPFEPPTDPTPAATTAALERNRAVVRTSKVAGWLPGYKVKGRRGETLARRQLVRCNTVRRPAAYSGLGLLTVLTVDLAKGLALVDTDSIVADGRTVYASPKSMYVATQRWFAQPVAAGADPPKVTTAIHKFDISDPASTNYRGSGTVSGYLMNQWSLSEHEGVLRVASTEEPTWWNPGPQEESESFVTTLREQDGALTQLGRVGGLGKGERVYAVRFDGDTGYVVTFRQVDPLYTLDLSQPSRPAVLGELKIRGFSAYLHPLDGDLLLGVGQDASEQGRVLGTQLSLFDVSDLRRPVRLHTTALGSSWSEAESDHHAFLWWQPSRLAVLPLQAYAEKQFVGAVGFRVGRSGITEAGRVTHVGSLGAGDGNGAGGIPIRRSVVVGDGLYTVSDQGVMATALATFDEQGWVGFPASSAGGAVSKG